MKSWIPVNVSSASHVGGNRWAPSSRAWRHVFTNISGDRCIDERRGWVRSVEEWKNLSAARGRQTNPVTQYFASVTTLPMFPVSETSTNCHTYFQDRPTIIHHVGLRYHSLGRCLSQS